MKVKFNYALRNNAAFDVRNLSIKNKKHVGNFYIVEIHISIGNLELCKLFFKEIQTLNTRINGNWGSKLNILHRVSYALFIQGKYF